MTKFELLIDKQALRFDDYVEALKWAKLYEGLFHNKPKIKCVIM